MADEHAENSSSEEDTNDYFKNPMKRRIHDIQKLNLQNKEMLMMAGHNKKLAQSIQKQKSLTKLIQQNQTKNFANTSLCGCTTTSRFRSCVMTVVFNSWFDKLILLTIFANCICLAIEDPSLEEPDPIIEALDLIFLLIFSMEMVLKIIAMGFVMEPFSYLRDPWNILDFSVVILGWFSLSAKQLNISAIRVIRILRPLRTLNSLQGMRGLVLTLLNSLPSVLNILLLFCFTLVIFGTIGVQLFKGIFQSRCVSLPTINEDDYSTEVYLENLDGDTLYCSEGFFECPDGYECLVRGNPGVGLQNWDNIALAVLTQFEMITLEGWSDVMYKVRNAYGGQMTYDIFFIFSVVFGAFFVLNLMIAVQYNYLDDSFNEIEQQKEKDAKAAAAEAKENEMQQALTDKIIAKNAEQTGEPVPDKVVKISCWQRVKTACKCLQFDPKTVCCKCWMDMSYKVQDLVQQKCWVILIVILILLNSLALATEHYEQPDWLTDAQRIANIVFTVIFTFEMIFSMIGHGIKGYFDDGFNIFDFVIVLLSLIDLAITLSSDDENSGGFITVLRGFRLLRIFKLVKSWTTLQSLLKTVIDSVSSISNLAVLSLLFLFVYSLIGKQFFYGELLDEEGEYSRYTFNSTPDAMVTMFIVLSGENWNYVMTTVALTHDGQQFLAVMFFVSAVLIGNFMLLNLFLAILLKFLQDAVDEVRKSENRNEVEQLMEDQQKAIEISKQKDLEFHKKIYQNEQNDPATNRATPNDPNAEPQVRPEDTQNKEAESEGAAEEKTEKSENGIELAERPAQANGNADGEVADPSNILIELNIKEEVANTVLQANQLAEASEEAGAGSYSPVKSTTNAVRNDTGILRQTNEKQSNPQKQLKRQKSVGFAIEEEPAEKSEQRKDFEANLKKNPTLQRKNTDYSTSMTAKNAKIVKKKKRLNEIIIDGNALGCIPETNRCRIKLGKFAENPYFESFIFNLIGLNSLFLAIEEPVLEDDYSLKTLELFGNVVSGLFIGECLIKILVMGFVKGKHSYLKDNYNRLDFIIVCFSIVSWILESSDTGIDISYLKALRALRALRPLKLVSKNEGMKLVVNSILASIPNLINVFLISILFYFVFGVIGLQMLMGRVSFCEPSIELNKDECLAAGGEWTVPENNYNHIFASMTTFFEVSTLETWPDIMFAAIDTSSEQDEAPIKDNRKWISLLFISFIFVTTFFVMNLFISVIVGQFNEQKEKSEGSASLSDEQKEWVKIQRFMAEVKAPVIEVAPTNPCRLKVYNFVRQEWFDQYFITTIIVLNTITMCMDYYGASDTYLQVLEICNLIFVAIFTMEAILKLIGLGPTYYFYVDWNKFDFIVVILSLVSLGDNESFNLTALRIIRVARLLRMIKSSKELQSLLKTLYLAMNNIANVALLFMLIIFTFAVAGMTLFGDIIEGQYGMINQENLNFRTFYMSTSVLVRSSTGESWNQIMHDCAYDKGSISYFYWMVFQLASFFIFLNVFIAVIYEEFQNVNQVESTLEVLSLKKRDIQSFLDTWGEFNQGGQHYMPTTKFTDFMRRLPAPLGYRGLNIDKSKLDKIIFCLNIKDHEGYVYFPEVMWSVFYSIIGKNDKELHECKPMRNIMRKVKNKYTGLGRNTSLDMLCGNKFYRNEMTVTKYICGKVILENLRILRKRRLDRDRAENNQSSLGRTTVYLEKQAAAHAWKNQNFLRCLWDAITRGPDSMSTATYVPQKIRIQKDAHGLKATDEKTPPKK